MYKIAILGTENSHANNFTKIVKGGYGLGDGYPDFEIVGVYGSSPEANEKLKEMGVPYVAENYDEFVGKVDAIMITARHGDNHLKYAEPYFKCGIPMFIDKPFTISEEEALTLARKAKENNCPLCGGSVLRVLSDVKEIKNQALPCLKGENESMGKVVGGSVSAPLFYMENTGGFFFYSQHLVEMILEVFGPDMRTVQAFVKTEGRAITVVCRYDDFDVTAHFGAREYSITVHTQYGMLQKTVDSSTDSFQKEFEDFARTVRYHRMEVSFDTLLRPVFVLNAMNRSIESGKEEEVHTFEF